MTDDPVTWTWMSDDPLESSSADPRARFFDRSAFVASTVGAIRLARRQSKSSVFGLIGAWGSGKTTMVAAIAEGLRSSDWTVHHFNPWLYADSVSLKWEFFSELRAVVPPGDRWNDTRRNLERLRNVVVPIASTANIFGMDFSGPAKDLLDPERVSAMKMREKVASQLVDLVNPVLIVLDDLDRLSADELLEVFKLVRFIGRLPNVYYLLCYDERTLVDLLEKTDLVGERNDRRAIDYLEKIVQLHFDIPPVRTDLAEELFETALRGLAEKSLCLISQADDARLRQLVRLGLIQRLTTPRAFRHYFAQLEAFLPSVVNEVNLVDFVLVSWIRAFEPGLYGQLQRNRRFLLTGFSGDESDKSKAKQKLAGTLKELLSKGGVSEQEEETVLAVLKMLFPIIARVATDRDISYVTMRDERSIADVFYFDRYFNLGVPPDDLPDATVRAALRTLGHSGSPTSEESKLARHLKSDCRRTIEKIERERTRKPEESARIVRWFFAQVARLPQQDGWNAPREQVAYSVARVIVDVDSASAINLVGEALRGGLETSFTLLHASYVLLGLESGSQDDIQAWNERGAEIWDGMRSELPATLKAAIDRPVFEVDDIAWHLITMWGSRDDSGPRELIRRQIDAGRWSMLDVVARLVTTTALTRSGPEERSVIAGFDESWVFKFIDVERALTTLADQVRSAGYVSDFYRLEASVENRRSYALACLKKAQALGAE